MTKLHKNARLLPNQRSAIRTLYLSGVSIKALSEQFQVNRKTVDKWAKRVSCEDLPSGRKPTGSKIITPSYKEAIREIQTNFPHYGTRTITYYLQKEFPMARRGTVRLVIEELSRQKETVPIEKKVKCRSSSDSDGLATVTLCGGGQRI